MRAFRLIRSRQLGAIFSASAGAAIALFLSAAAVRLAFLMRAAEGTVASLPWLWALSAVPFLPALAALLTMRSIAGERHDGCIDLLLSAPVRERDIVLGKTAAAYFVYLFAVAIYLIVPLAMLPGITSGGIQASFAEYLPALLALAFQGVFWCSLGVLCSAFTRHGAVAAAATVLLGTGVPYAVHYGAMFLLPAWRASVAAPFPETQIHTLATGVVSTADAAACALLSALALFIASKAVAALRFRYRGAIALKVSSFTAVVLAAVFSALAIWAAYRGEVLFNLAGEGGVSPELRELIEETRESVDVTCFMPRSSPQFRETARMLRAAGSIGGGRIRCSIVDPRWDRGKAASLVLDGAPTNSLVVSLGHRRVSVPAEGGEFAFASALRRVASPRRACTVYFTTGHGENDPRSDDSVSGCSDLVRALKLNGYGVDKLDLAAVTAVPPECAALVMCGPRTELPDAERKMLKAWLQRGGRLLYLAHGPTTSLADWGVEVTRDVVQTERTHNGVDSVITVDSSHSVMAPLRGESVTMERPLALKVAAESEQPDAAADRVASTPLLAAPNGSPLAVALQRGGAVKDLAVRPTRIVVVGCDTFALNGQLAAHGGANLGFVLNAVSWLAGVDAIAKSFVSPSVFRSGFDRVAYVRFAFVSAVAFPLTLFLAMFIASRRRARRL